MFALTFSDLNLNRVIMAYQRSRQVASRLLEHAKVFPHRPGYRPPDARWVQDFTTRASARSPFTAQRELFKLLTQHEDFVKSVPDGVDLLLEFAVDAVSIRANLYLVEVSNCEACEDHSRTPLFDPAWPTAGIYRYHVSPKGDVMFLIRNTPGYTYDPRDIVYSYARNLTTDEHQLVVQLSRL